MTFDCANVETIGNKAVQQRRLKLVVGLSAAVDILGVHFANTIECDAIGSVQAESSRIDLPDSIVSSRTISHANRSVANQH